MQVALDEAVEAIQAKMSQRKAIGCKRVYCMCAHEEYNDKCEFVETIGANCQC